MTLLSFVSMYVLMYAMVNVFGNVVSNLNQFYMAGFMTVPMVVIELILMGKMYPKQKTQYDHHRHQHSGRRFVVYVHPPTDRHHG